MKEKIIKQIGITIAGNATINLWGGGQAVVEMDRIFLPNDKITPKNILRCVNDGCFGCEFIEESDMSIYIRFDNRTEEFDRGIHIYHEIHQQYFNGWKELRQQGIKV